MLEVIRQDYVRTAKAKGIPEEVVYYKHALRNALLPIITIFGFLIPSLIGGSIIIETVFAWPGIGRLSFQAVLARDYPVVMTILTISAVLTLLGILLQIFFTESPIRESDIGNEKSHRAEGMVRGAQHKGKGESTAISWLPAYGTY